MAASWLLSPISQKFMKGLLALWFQDSKILALTSGVGFDVFTSKTSSFLEARRAQRFFEEIADNVLSDLSDFIEKEYKLTPKGDVKASVDSISSFISSINFHKLCSEERNNIDRIIGRARDENKESSDDIKVSSEVYFSIQDFLIIRFVSIVECLPSHTLNMLTVLLEDTENINEKLAQIEIKLESLRSGLEIDEDENIRLYRKHLIKKYSTVTLFGVDARSLSKKYNLSLAYIDLHIARENEEEKIKVEDALSSIHYDDSRFIIISGEAGSGKTTITSWFAMNYANFSFPKDFSFAYNIFPVFIKLRDFNNGGFPKGANIFKSQLGHFADLFQEKWISAKLQDQNVVFFLDGLDEVSPLQRDELLEWIRGLHDFFENAKFVLTTRPYLAEEIKDDIQIYSDVIEFEIQAMSTSQINDFIDHWYDAYSHEAVDVEQLRKLSAAKERLNSSIVENNSIRMIANNPLLCALICYVNADRDGFVPSDRGELYHIAIETLVDRRERERSIDHIDFLNLNKSQKIKILSIISEYFFKRRSSQLPIEEVSHYLREYLPYLKIESDKSNSIVIALSQRSLVLRSPVDGFVDFSHKTFQEFFYAKRICDINLCEIVSEGFFDDDLREVVLFASSMMNISMANAIFPDVIEICKKLKDESRVEVVFLSANIRLVSEVSPEIRSDIDLLIKGILPPRSIEEAELISLAGESLIHSIKEYADAKYKKYWGFCAVALISTYDIFTFSTLRLFAELGDKSVDRIIFNSRKFFEEKDYISSVVSYCKTIEEITIEDNDDFNLALELPMMKKVTFRGRGFENSKKINKSVLEAEIRDCNDVSDCEILESFPNLKRVEIVDCPIIDDFDVIGNLNNLKYLVIYSDFLQDFEFIRGHRAINSIDASESVNIIDVKALNTINNLEFLDLPYGSLYDQLSDESRFKSIIS